MVNLSSQDRLKGLNNDCGHTDIQQRGVRQSGPKFVQAKIYTTMLCYPILQTCLKLLEKIILADRVCKAYPVIKPDRSTLHYAQITSAYMRSLRKPLD